MICINVCCSEVEQIKTNHTDFVKKEIEQRIDFYINVCELLMKIHKTPKLRKGKIILEVKALATKSDLKIEKSLLKALFKNKKTEIKKDVDIAKIKYAKNLLVTEKNSSDIIGALIILKEELDFVLSYGVSEHTNFRDLQYHISHIDFLIEKIFDYKWFTDLSPNDKGGAYWLTRSLQINSCPYCNRQYCFTVDKLNEKITRPELDHFLPRSKYPVLALSFYNLIPSCPTCNFIKRDNEINLLDYLSPYQENNDHGAFSFDFSPLTYSGAVGDTDEILVEIKPSEWLTPDMAKRVENNIELFKLREIYKMHRDTVQDMISKKWISNDSYLEILNNTFKGFKMSKEEIYRLSFGNYYNESEFAKRPFSKLTKDIAKKLKLI